MDTYIAQPLYVSGLVIPGQGTHNAVIVATENDTVYAFDAETAVRGQTADCWRYTNLGIAVSSCNNEFGNLAVREPITATLSSSAGITSTPVIDLASGTRSTWMSTDSREVGATTNYYHRIHALNITNGAEQACNPVGRHRQFGVGHGRGYRHTAWCL